MSNVTFANNTPNRILIDSYFDSPLLEDATLIHQPGLEGYEISEFGDEVLHIPTGITLTVESGVTLMFPGDSYALLNVEGHLEATGTAVSPTTFTTVDNSEWDGIHMENGASVHLNHAIVQYGALDARDSVLLENTIFQESFYYPIAINADALHRLQMSNVTFVDNNPNRVLILADYYTPLVADVTLTDQPGLEGYEIIELNQWSPELRIPYGITLTLNPGVTMMFGGDYSRLFVEGHLEAVGTLEAPIIFTTAENVTSSWGTIAVGDEAGAHLSHVIIRYVNGLSIGGSSGNPILVENSIIQESFYYPITIESEALHRLQMFNVTFMDNSLNRVLIDLGDGIPLTANATLTSQPGLEGYEIQETYQGWPELSQGWPELRIPTGITLTLKPGVTMMFDYQGYLFVEGHLEATGTADSPVIFTSSIPGGWEGVIVPETGTAHLNHVVIHNGFSNLYMWGANGGAVLIENSTISHSTVESVVVNIDSLHRLQMSNVTFEDNFSNRVILHMDDTTTVVADTVLSDQPGLEGYEVFEDGSVNANLIIPSGIRLKLEAGTTLMMPGYLQVHGQLEAIGLPTNPITFTSTKNTAAGEWAGIVLQGGTAEFAHTTIRYANNGLTVRDGQVTAVCSTITDNQMDGILVDSLGSPVMNISYSTFAGNGGEGLNNDSPVQVDARFNYWGTADGPGGEGPGSGDEVSGNVLYTPWLENPTCSAFDGHLLYLPTMIKP